MTKRTFADIKAMKKPNETSVEIILEPELTRLLGELQRRMVREERIDAKENRAPVAPRIQKEIDALTEQVEDVKTVFRFRDPGRKKFEELVESCPPTAAQKKAAKEAGDPQPSWDNGEFVPRLIALASLDPDLTLDDATEIYDNWGRGDVEALFDTALQACLEQASVPFTRRDIDAILSSVQSSTIASGKESLTPGS